MRYDRHSIVALEEVIPLIGTTRERVLINGIPVKVSALRLRTFKGGLQCVACSLQASHFAIERDKNTTESDGPYHINLYGMRDGKEILFTHDHTLARSLGGKDDLSNTETMCSPCNSKKGAQEQKLKSALHREAQKNG